MKTILLILTFFISTVSMAQDPGEDTKRAERIQALKIAFITQKLNLTADEAQKFWPVYTSYETELRQVIKSGRDGNVIEGEEKLLNIRKRFHPEFSKIIGQPRVNKLFGAEKEFRGVLMRQLKNKGNQQNRGNHQRPPMRR